MLCLFIWKIFCEESFSRFLCLVVLKKKKKPTKNSIKNDLFFINFFLLNFFFQKKKPNEITFGQGKPQLTPLHKSDGSNGVKGAAEEGKSRK